MNILWRCSLPLLLGALACAPHSPSPSASSDSVDADSIDQAVEADLIKQLESEWSDLYGARDLDGIIGLLAEESVLIVPGAEPIVGPDAIREATRQMLESEDEVSWSPDFAYVAPSGDMAYDYGTAITTQPDGTTVQGHYLVVWVKEDGEWKVAADIFN